MNSRFAVAVHILALLEYEPAASLSSNQIAVSVNTNPVVIRRILGMLSKSGLVSTTCGVDGGTCLARDAKDITLRDVYSATAQGELLPMPTSPPNSDCPCGRSIQPALGSVFQTAEQAVQDVFYRTTIADIVRDMRLSLAGAT